MHRGSIPCARPCPLEGCTIRSIAYVLNQLRRDLPSLPRRWTPPSPSDYWRRHQHRNATHRREHDRHHRGHRAGAERHVRHLRPGRRRRALLPRRRAPRAILRQAVGEPRAGAGTSTRCSTPRTPPAWRSTRAYIEKFANACFYSYGGPVPFPLDRNDGEYDSPVVFNPHHIREGLPRAERPREVPCVRTGRGGRGGQHRGRLRVL